MIAAVLLWPPISATNRPPGFNARWTPASTASARAHPMQCRVREHRVELAGEGQVLGCHHPGVETARAGGGDHVGGGVDRDHHRTGGGDLFGQHAIAAAEIENPLARHGRQQFEHRCAERRHEMRGLGIALRRPVLPRDLPHAQRPTRRNSEISISCPSFPRKREPTASHVRSPPVQARGRLWTPRFRGDDDWVLGSFASFQAEHFAL